MKQTVLAAALLAAGCVATTPTSVRPFQPSSGEIAQATELVARDLKDPGSIQTRNIRGYRAATGDRIICGEYNARNSFGGYAGFSGFYVRFTPENTVKVVVSEPDFALAEIGCNQAAAGSINLPAS